MARTLNRLTTRGVTALSDPGLHADGGGLYLRVDKNGSKRWAFVYVLNGKRREMGLGSAGDVKLADARTAASDAREHLKAKRDPMTARKGPKTTTFARAAAELIMAKRDGWKSRVHARQWVMTMRVYAKDLRPKPVRDIDTEDVLRCLKPIWLTKPETARRVRSRLEQVFDAAKAQGKRAGENPARWRGHLEHFLPKSEILSRGHYPALEYEDAPAFMLRLRAAPGMSARALEWLILTCTRESETTGAAWAEINAARTLWTIPKERTKSGLEHRVPLTTQAAELLGRMDVGGALVFPNSKRTELSNAAMDAVLDRMKLKATPHGFRSTFRDWAGDCTAFSREVAEACLAHKVGNAVERAYRRRDALEQRRKLLQAWADYLGGLAAAGPVNEGRELVGADEGGGPDLEGD